MNAMHFHSYPFNSSIRAQSLCLQVSYLIYMYIVQVRDFHFRSENSFVQFVSNTYFAYICIRMKKITENSYRYYVEARKILFFICSFLFFVLIVSNVEDL